MNAESTPTEAHKRVIVLGPTPPLPRILFSEEVTGPPVFPDTPYNPELIRMYVCVVCRQQKTLLRLRPQKLYACKECIDEHGGKDMLLSRLRQVPE